MYSLASPSTVDDDSNEVVHPVRVHGRVRLGVEGGRDGGSGVGAWWKHSLC